MIIFRSVGPVISTRRSCKSAGIGPTDQSVWRIAAVSGRKSGNLPASISRCRSARRSSRSSNCGTELADERFYKFQSVQVEEVGVLFRDRRPHLQRYRLRLSLAHNAPPFPCAFVGTAPQPGNCWEREGKSQPARGAIAQRSPRRHQTVSRPEWRGVTDGQTRRADDAQRPLRLPPNVEWVERSAPTVVCYAFGGRDYARPALQRIFTHRLPIGSRHG